MNPLDELREALTGNSGEHRLYFAHDRFHARVALDAFAAAHPGLVDLTVCGKQCPAWFDEWVDKGDDPDVDYSAECRKTFTKAPTGEPCPVLEARQS